MKRASIFGSVITALIIAIGAIHFREEVVEHLVRILDWIDGLGGMAALMFVAFYAVAIVCFVPAAPMLIAAGTLFGLVLGTALCLFANVIGGSASFWLARTRLRPLLLRRFRHFEVLRSLDRAIRAEGLRTVLLIRSVPVLPSWSINYGLGLSPARYTHYLLGLAAAIPGFVMYVYYGKVAGELIAILRGNGPPHGTLYYTLLALGLVAAVTVTVLLSRRTRRAMDATDGK